MATVNWEDPTWKKWLTFAEEHDCVVGATRDRFSPSEDTWLEHFNPKVKDLPMPQIPYGKGPMSGMSGPQNWIHCVKQQLVFFVGETCFEANIAWMMHRFYTTLGGIYIYIYINDGWITSLGMIDGAKVARSPRWQRKGGETWEAEKGRGEWVMR